MAEKSGLTPVATKIIVAIVLMVLTCSQGLLMEVCQFTLLIVMMRFK